MGLTFPTGHVPAPGSFAPTLATGTPARAQHCRCGDRQVVDPNTDQCVTCGRYPKRVITKTWHDRAQKVAGRQ